MEISLATQNDLRSSKQPRIFHTAAPRGGGAYDVTATPGVREWAFCGKSKVNTSGSEPVFSISTPPLLSADWVMKPISG